MGFAKKLTYLKIQKSLVASEDIEGRKGEDGEAAK